MFVLMVPRGAALAAFVILPVAAAHVVGGQFRSAGVKVGTASYKDSESPWPCMSTFGVTKPTCTPPFSLHVERTTSTKW